MLDRQILWDAPAQIHSVRWNGTDIDELTAWVESASSGAWTVTPVGSDGAVQIDEPMLGGPLVEAGDVVGFNGYTFDLVGPESGNFLPYPAEWIRNTL